MLPRPLGDVAVALHDDDALGIDVERVRDDLHVAGLDALAHRLHRRAHDDAPVRLDVEGDALLVHHTGPLQE